MNKPHIAIVGAGASGVAMFIALVRMEFSGKISIIDPIDFGVGQVYVNKSDEMICNSSVDLMSLLPRKDDDLLDYLINVRGIETTPFDFIKRKTIGEYLKYRYEEYSSIARARGIEINLIRQAAVGVVKQDRQYKILLDDGETFADHVILTIGYGKGIKPDILKDGILPYPEDDMLRAVGKGKNVLIVGTKLSAIDTAILLCSQDCKVTMVSPSGELPAVRSALVGHSMGKFYKKAVPPPFLRDGSDVDSLFFDTLECLSSVPLSEQFYKCEDNRERLKKEIAIALSGKSDWQDIIIAYVDYINEKYTGSDFSELYKLKSFFSRYLGAMPLDNALKLNDYFDNGMLECKKSTIRSVSKDSLKYQVFFEGGECSNYDAVVLALGHELPALRVLNNQVFISPAEGVSANDDLVFDGLGLILDREKRDEKIWCIGTASQGNVPFFNSLYIAVQQADKVAREITSQTLPDYFYRGNSMEKHIHP